MIWRQQREAACCFSSASSTSAEHFNMVYPLREVSMVSTSIAARRMNADS
jgi:hypothetical protein